MAIWRWLRWVLGLALAGLAVWAVSGRTGELSGASDYLAHLHWWWVVAAAGAEALSYLSFAAMQKRLLDAGGLTVGLRPLSGITVAGNAIQVTLPGGVVLAAAFAYRQYRRFGADEVLAGWVMVAMTALSIITLSALAAAGLAVGASAGNAYDLASVIIGVARDRRPGRAGVGQARLSDRPRHPSRAAQPAALPSSRRRSRQW